MQKKFRLLYALMATIWLLGTVACSKDSEPINTMLERIPADADVAAVVNVKRLVESAGGNLNSNEIVLPDYIIQNFDVENFNETKQKIEESGLDIEQIGFFAKTNPYFSTLIFKVIDENKLKDYLVKDGFKECGTHGDFKAFIADDQEKGSYRRQKNCITGDGYAYFFDDNLTSSTITDRITIIDEASSAPISATEYGRYAAQGNAAGAIVNTKTAIQYSMRKLPFPMPDNYSGYVSFKADTNEDEAVIKSALFDTEGQKKDFNDLGVSFDKSATISADAMAYFPPSECLVFATALKDVDWDAITSNIGQTLSDPMQRMIVSMMKTYLEKINGTVALGIGFDGNMNDLAMVSEDASVLKYIPFTVAIQTVQGKDKGLIGDISAVLATIGLNPTTSADGFSIQIPENGGTIYGKAENNTIILSTRPIQRYGDNEAVKAADMTRYIGACGLWLPKEYPLLQGLGITDDLTVCAVSDRDNSEALLRVKITGETKGAIVERILRLALQYKKGVEDIKEKIALQSNYTPEKDNNDYDRYPGFEPTYF